jgi:hypothetical protein
MDLGRISSFYPARPAATPASREPLAPVREPAGAAQGFAELRRSRAAEPAQVIEGELLQHSRSTAQPSTQDYLAGRQYQADSARTYRASTHAGPSSGNRHALGQYLDHTRPETRQSLSQGRTVDAFV